MKKLNRNKSGNAIVYSTIIATILFTISLTLTNTLLNSFHATANIALANISFFAAEGGIEQGIYALSGAGPGYQPAGGEVNQSLNNGGKMVWEVSNRIYDYTMVNISAGSDYTLPLYFSYNNGGALDDARIDTDWVNYNLYFYPTINEKTTECPEETGNVLSNALDKATGDYRISYLAYSSGTTVKKDDYDEGKTLYGALTTDDFATNEDFCWVDNDKDGSDFTSGDYLIFNTNNNDEWFNMSDPNGLFQAETAGEPPDACEKEVVGAGMKPKAPSNVTNIKYVASEGYRSATSFTLLNQYYYLDEDGDSSVSEGDYRITTYFDEDNDKALHYVDYASGTSNDIDADLGDISQWLKVEHSCITDIDGKDSINIDTISGCKIYGRINGNFYEIFPHLDLYDVVDTSNSTNYGTVTNIKSTNSELSKGFTLYIDTDDNNIVNPSVLARWTLEYQDLSDNNLTATRNFTTARGDAETNSGYLYWTNSKCDGSEYFSGTGTTPNSAESNVGNDVVSIGTTLTSRYSKQYITFTAYQDILLVFDPDPDNPYPDTIVPPTGSITTGATPFIPAPYIYLESRGSAGGNDGQFTEQVLRTRLDQSDDIAIFSHTVVF